MTVFLLSFVVMTLAVGGMAIGVLCGRRPIAGSCGGIAANGEGGCAACTRPCARARRRRAEAGAGVEGGPGTGHETGVATERNAEASAGGEAGR